MKVKEKSEKVGLKPNIQKIRIMASGPITSWRIDGETMETVTDFILGGSKITADGDYSHEIKRHLLLGRKAVTNLDTMLKSRDISLPTKVCLVKDMVFPVVMYGCELDYKESWALKNWCFWTVVLEKTKWTWVWVNCKSSWWTGKPGMQQSMGPQRVRYNWATELNWMKGDKNIVEGGGCCFSVAQSCPTLCDPMDCCMPGFLVLHYLLECALTYVHWIGDTIQASHPLSSPSSPAFTLSSMRGFSNESVLHIRWPKYWNFSFSISPSNEYSQLISFMID